MGGVHRIDNGSLVAEQCQIDDIAFRVNACMKLHFRLFFQREGEECRHPKRVS